METPGRTIGRDEGRGRWPGDHHPEWSKPSFQFYHGLSDGDLRDLRRDPGWVVDRLLRSIAEPGGEDHRKKVLRALLIYLDEVDGPEQTKRFIARGVRMLASGTLPIGLETDLVSAVARRSGSFGMEEAERKAFRVRCALSLGETFRTPTMRRFGLGASPNWVVARRRRLSGVHGTAWIATAAR